MNDKERFDELESRLTQVEDRLAELTKYAEAKRESDKMFVDFYLSKGSTTVG